MAGATSLKSFHQPLHHGRRHHHSHSFSIFLKTQIKFSPKLQQKPLSTSHNYFPLITASIASSSSTITPAKTTVSFNNEDTCSFDALAGFLASGDYRQADEETRRLLISLAGEASQKRGYVFFSEVKFISSDDLRAIDELWWKHSGKFGYSVQRHMWEKTRRDFTRFFIRIGWMKKLDTEVEQYNYRAFPDEFVWELAASTPEGHLPLTNALRGTQLLQSILTHPAFKESFEQEEDGKDENQSAGMMKDGEKKEEDKKEGRERFKLLKSLKPDYSF